MSDIEVERIPTEPTAKELLKMKNYEVEFIDENPEEIGTLEEAKNAIRSRYPHALFNHGWDVVGTLDDEEVGGPDFSFATLSAYTDSQSKELDKGACAFVRWLGIDEPESGATTSHEIWAQSRHGTAYYVGFVDPAKVKAARNRAQLSIEEAANKAGMESQMSGAIENDTGVFEVARNDKTLNKIAKAIGCAAVDLLVGKKWK